MRNRFEYDYLVIGAGFAGVVFSECVGRNGKRCLVIDKRNHIGGNAYDAKDKNGILLHKYGPHYFRTNSSRIVEYLSKFTKWHPADYRIKSYTNGRYWSFPINLNTFEEYLGRISSQEEFEAWIEENRTRISVPRNSEEVITSQVGVKLYRMFFEGYTLKQWKLHPRLLDASVCGRIPIRTNRDDRYLSESFQALPSEGYTKLFENILSTSNNVTVSLGTQFLDIKDKVKYKKIVYTGPIDEYYNYCYGPLPYRSLRFEEQYFNDSELARREAISGKKGFWQPTVQVNYPNDGDFTRIVELKHLTGQSCSGSTIVKEFPENYEPGRDPYYPIPTKQATQLYEKYRKLSLEDKNVIFLGRLGTYKYYNMDQIIGMALKKAEDELLPK